MPKNYNVVNEFGEVVGTVKNDVFILYRAEMGFVGDYDALYKYLWHLGLDLVEA